MNLYNVRETVTGKILGQVLAHNAGAAQNIAIHLFNSISLVVEKV